MHNSGDSHRENAESYLNIIARSDLSAAVQQAKSEATKQSPITVLIVIPAKAGIQYAALSRFRPRSLEYWATVFTGGDS
jgi:hypothetical protein